MSSATATVPLGEFDGLVRPTRRDEAWRYAPHRQLDQLTFGPSSGTVSDVDIDLDDRLPALDGPRIVIVNGVVDHDRCRLVAFAGGSLAPLGGAAVTDTVPPADAYAAFNLAYGTDGALIEVDDGVTVDAVIHVVDIAIPESGGTVSSSNVVIRVGAGSSVTVVETRIGAGTAVGGSNVRTSITLGANATLDHVLVQDLPAEQVHLSRVEAVQAERSTLRTRSFNLGASYGRLAYHVELDGPEAFADLAGLYFGAGEQILDQQITVVHHAADCTSRQTFRGVLDDASTGVFNGGIDVCPGADGTDAEQSNDNLLLSNRAEVNTQPRLEILADEVACKHGATVGQLDDTALYYLRSRGIAAEEARRLLINGFADQIVDEVSIETVREWITRRLGHDHD